MSRRFWIASLAMFLTAVGLSSARAVVTPQVLVNFDGSLSGTAYTLGPGEIDNSFTFSANGSVSISGGVADIPGDTDRTAGFLFSGGDLVIEQGLGSLRTTNWVTEAHFMPDVAAANQPQPQEQYGNHFLDVQGDTFYRYDGFGRPDVVTDFGYWDGGSEDIEPAGEPIPGIFNHVALVWDASTNSVEAFLNGVSQGIATTGNAFDVSSPNVGYGFFSRFLDRAVDGKLDAVAFSTFTGAFNPATDFQLAVIPEPGSFVLIGMAFAGLAQIRRR
jgi:hypothetical protein